MKRATLLSAIGLVLGAGGWAVWANTCILDARGEFTDCQAACLEDFQIAKDACINKDHPCVEACRAEREDCITATGLQAALDACHTQTHKAILACNGDSNCIEQAQVVGFECRLAARTAAKPALKQCRVGFRTCVGACPAGTGTPAENPTACRLAARQDFLGCKATCRTTFQTEKDACLNRSHPCVDGCRTTRDSCDATVQGPLDQQITQCNATRDAAIANCKKIYADGSQAQADCIENAQVAAFSCREDAREAARPGFAQCQADFISCAQGCPPASPSGAFVD
jgi:hypothetical protein